MRWPWQRRAPEPGAQAVPVRHAPDARDAAGAGAAGTATMPAPSPTGWAFHPPLQRTIASDIAIHRGTGVGWTATGRNPLFTGSMTHLVTGSSYSGVVDGDGGGLGGRTVPHVPVPPTTPTPPTAAGWGGSAPGTTTGPVANRLTRADSAPGVPVLRYAVDATAMPLVSRHEPVPRGDAAHEVPLSPPDDAEPVSAPTEANPGHGDAPPVAHGWVNPVALGAPDASGDVTGGRPDDGTVVEIPLPAGRPVDAAAPSVAPAPPVQRATTGTRRLGLGAPLHGTPDLVVRRTPSERAAGPGPGTTSPPTPTTSQHAAPLTSPRAAPATSAPPVASRAVAPPTISEAPTDGTGGPVRPATSGSTTSPTEDPVPTEETDAGGSEHSGATGAADQAPTGQTRQDGPAVQRTTDLGSGPDEPSAPDAPPAVPTSAPRAGAADVGTLGDRPTAGSDDASGAVPDVAQRSVAMPLVSAAPRADEAAASAAPGTAAGASPAAAATGSSTPAPKPSPAIGTGEPPPQTSVQRSAALLGELPTSLAGADGTGGTTPRRGSGPAGGDELPLGRPARTDDAADRPVDPSAGTVGPASPAGPVALVLPAGPEGTAPPAGSEGAPSSAGTVAGPAAAVDERGPAGQGAGQRPAAATLGAASGLTAITPLQRTAEPGSAAVRGSAQPPLPVATQRDGGAGHGPSAVQLPADPPIPALSPAGPGGGGSSATVPGPASQRATGPGTATPAPPEPPSASMPAQAMAEKVAAGDEHRALTLDGGAAVPATTSAPTGGTLVQRLGAPQGAGSPRRADGAAALPVATPPGHARRGSEHPAPGDGSSAVVAGGGPWTGTAGEPGHPGTETSILGVARSVETPSPAVRVETTGETTGGLTGLTPAPTGGSDPSGSRAVAEAEPGPPAGTGNGAGVSRAAAGRVRPLPWRTIAPPPSSPLARPVAQRAATATATAPRPVAQRAATATATATATAPRPAAPRAATEMAATTIGTLAARHHPVLATLEVASPPLDAERDVHVRDAGDQPAGVAAVQRAFTVGNVTSSLTRASRRRAGTHRLAPVQRPAPAQPTAAAVSDDDAPVPPTAETTADDGGHVSIDEVSTTTVDRPPQDGPGRGAGGTGLAATELASLADALYPRLLRRMRHEILLDRERRGVRTDRRVP